MNFLPVLQVLKIDPNHAVKFRQVDILLEQDFQILHGGAGCHAALKGQHDFAITRRAQGIFDQADGAVHVEDDSRCSGRERGADRDRLSGCRRFIVARRDFVLEIRP